MLKTYYIVTLGLTRITPSALLVKARNMVTKLTGNLAFTTPTPALADVTAASDLLEAAINAHQLNPGPGELIDREVAFEKLKGLLTDLAGYVQAASNGDLELIKSAGCTVRRSPSPVGEMPMPKDVVAQNSLVRGRIEVRWRGVRGRSMYELEICSSDPTIETNWKVLVLTTKNRHTLDGLVSDSVYYFRVKAIGTAGVGPLSDSAHAKAA